MNVDKYDSINICYKSAVRYLLKEAAANYKEEKKFLPETLLKLRCLFGSTFERALELYEGKKVTLFTVKNKEVTCYFYEVVGQHNEIYTILPNINFCSCLAFEIQVLKEQNTFTCKHILAVWLASVSSDEYYLNTQSIQETKILESLFGRFSYMLHHEQ